MLRALPPRRLKMVDETLAGPLRTAKYQESHSCAIWTPEDLILLPCVCTDFVYGAYGALCQSLPQLTSGEDGEGGEADGQETGAAAGEEQPAEQQEGQVAAEDLGRKK
eukprot:855163-Amphidinium_carterae.2